MLVITVIIGNKTTRFVFDLALFLRYYIVLNIKSTIVKMSKILIIVGERQVYEKVRTD